MAKRDELKQASWIVVLNDDETFTGLGGSHFAMLTAEQKQELDDGAEPHQLDGLAWYELKELLDWAIDHGYFDETN
jgi:hypothetical protein